MDQPTAADQSPALPEPDDKDWTWTTVRRCPECGFDPTSLPASGIGEALRETTPRWVAVLGRDGVADRPSPTVWSALEYGCHVRDVHRLFGARTALMLEQDEPRFANWDQDETAIRERYWEQDAAAVALELAGSGEESAALFDEVRDHDWARRGFRSNGSEFTLAGIGRYYVHDVVHHLHDVEG